MTLHLLLSACRRLAFSGLLVCGSIAVAAATGTDNNNPKAASASNSSNSAAVVRGIDVSRWQKEVDWDMVSQSGVSFSFIKATEGDYKQDPFFARNWEETKRHGIKRGAYHFYKPEIPVARQVELFTSTVTIEPGDLPPVLDLEVMDRELTPEQLRKDVRTWLEAVTAHYGVRPIIYTGQNYYRRYLKGYFPDYHFWIARYSDVKPDIHHTDSWMFWQFTDRGSIAGINSAVDINFFAGDFEQLNLLCVPEFMAHNRYDRESPLSQLKHLQPLP
ncbi:glycoside hydrolase family 25 protein [Pontibacter anaerobius]|uniref:GH25 family lysozyme n=1 Tax=Pontibacter anaerobius TaxID=2993940 RepID=A0ABT3RGM2_9BACT|nr:GH25 family lysozyme [Pontibacter anaerobius]MCX2740512.1 GH25 family lysozyme [Pontibacter anaerobius]